MQIRSAPLTPGPGRTECSAEQPLQRIWTRAESAIWRLCMSRWRDEAVRLFGPSPRGVDDDTSADRSVPTIVSQRVRSRPVRFRASDRTPRFTRENGTTRNSAGRPGTTLSALIMLRSQVRFLLAPLNTPGPTILACATENPVRSGPARVPTPRTVRRRQRRHHRCARSVRGR